MAQLADTLRLVELVCARLCHDLGGLIGTVGNALDMVAEDAGRENEVLAYADTAAKGLTQRLRLMRTAWGPEADPLPLGAITRLTTQSLSARRVGLDATGISRDCIFASPVGRVLLNLILLASDCMPHGGTIRLLGDSEDLLIRIDGPGAAWPTGLATVLRDEAAAFAALHNARSVQMPLTALLAMTRGLILSPVLGRGPGIEALRLSVGADGS